MNYKRKLPVSKDTGVVWAYWVSRDSINGELSGKCHLWRERPLRTKIGGRVTWVDADHRAHASLGQHDPRTVVLWFGTCPDTDLELVYVEQGVTEKMLAYAKEQEK